MDSLKFLEKLVRIKTVSADASCAENMYECANFLSDFFKERGFECDVANTDMHPIVFARRNSKNGDAKARILCYGHYDVQPHDPISEWKTPPFEPTIKDGKIWGRGTADNKGPFTTMISAIMNLLEKDENLPLDIAFLLEGEEEISSPSMPKFITDNKDMLSEYDFVLLSDTMSPSINQIQITTALRGVVSFDVNFRGANTDLHSGMYGGLVYNPIQAMAEVCASLHSANGRVNVDGFYDDVVEPSQWEKDELKKLSITEDSVKEMLDLTSLYEQSAMQPLESTRFYPTLEFNGISGGYEGDGNKTVIASECFCKISCRLVANQDPARIIDLVQKAIAERCPKQVKVSFNNHDGLASPYFNDINNPKNDKEAKVFESLKASIRESFGCEAVFLRDGGSIALIAMLKQIIGLDSLMIGLFTPEDALHAPNESFYLDILAGGVKMYENFFTKLSK
ncbi:MAG: M20/M25/M40 family metallo-hydrolase [Opitutales bacterium]